jgi:hypothetical protein
MLESIETPSNGPYDPKASQGTFVPSKKEISAAGISWVVGRQQQRARHFLETQALAAVIGACSAGSRARSGRQDEAVDMVYNGGPVSAWLPQEKEKAIFVITDLKAGKGHCRVFEHIPSIKRSSGRT